MNFPNDPGLLGSVPILRPEQFGPATGSDGTSVVQSAINAASALAQLNAGLVDVALTPGAAYNLGQLSVAAGVRIWAYGAVINPLLAEINQALFYYPTAGASLNRFEIRGGTWRGIGTEGSGANSQMLFEVASGAGCNDVRFQDMEVLNWGSCVYYIRNALRARVLDNVLQTIGQANPTLLNSVNFVVDGTFNQGQRMQARGNIIEGSQAGAIAYVNVNNSGPTDVGFSATDNICTGSNNNTGNSVSGAINLELDGAAAATFTRFLIAHNHINATRPNGDTVQGINIGQGSGASTIAQYIIDDNTVIASGTGQTGINSRNCPDGSITNNRINAPTPITAAGVSPFRSGNRFSAGPMSGRVALAAGTATVNTAEVQAGDNILLSTVAPGGTRGEVQLGAIVAGTSFVINSIQPGTASTIQNLDTSTIYWKIDH